MLGKGTGAVVKLIFTSPAEYFMAVIKVSLLGGIYLALPVILYQLLGLCEPGGLLPHERRWAIPIVVGAFSFFTVGALFSYFLLPTGLQFLVGFAPADVEPLLTVGKYLGFAAGLLFATGLAFLLPLFLLGLSVAGIVTSYFWRATAGRRSSRPSWRRRSSRRRSTSSRRWCSRARCICSSS